MGLIDRQKQAPACEGGTLKLVWGCGSTTAIGHLGDSRKQAPACLCQHGFAE